MLWEKILVGVGVVALSGCGLFGGGSDDPNNMVAAGIGDACTSTSECRTTLACSNGTCQPLGIGEQGTSCALTADCAAGLFCDARRLCATAGAGASGDRCNSTGDCAAGLSCVLAGFSGACQTPTPGNRDLGDACSSSSDCFAGLTCAPDPSSGAPVCLSAPAVTGDVTPPPSIPFWAGQDCGADVATARAYFEVPRAGVTQDFYRLPFPNDALATSTGISLEGHPHPGTVLPVDVIDRYLRASETDLKGFSTNPLMYFRFSQPYDWGHIADSIALIDITEGSPTYGWTSGLSWQTTSGELTKYICKNWLALRTPHGSPLRPNTTYAMVLKTSMRTSGNSVFSRAPDFDAVMAATAPTDPALMKAWEAYAPLRAFAAVTGNNLDANIILNAAVFTTQDPEEVPRAIHTAVRAGATPVVSDLTLCAAGVTSPCDDGTEDHACGAPNENFHEIHGRIALPIFQSGTAPYLEPEDGGGVTLSSEGVATPVRTEQVCFALTIPKAATMPTDGWPLVMYAHGTGGAFTAAARIFASDVSTGAGVTSPSATLAIDMPNHGSRAAGSTVDVEQLVYNFGNPRAARGNMLQGAADLTALVHFAVNGSISATDSPTSSIISFDDTRLSLFAHSQGATHAGLMIGFETDIDSVVLSGEGGDLVQSLMHKSEPIDIAAVFPYVLLDANDRGGLAGGEYHPVLGIFQNYFELVDPVNFAFRIRREPITGSTGMHVFMTYGPGDTSSPEQTMQAYANAADLPLVTPAIVDFRMNSHIDPPVSGNVTINSTSRTIGLRQYMPNTGDDGHFVSTQTTQGRADVMRFLNMTSGGLVPQIGAGS